MKLTDTDIIRDALKSIRVENNNIYDYSPDGNYAYCLNVCSRTLNDEGNYPLVARIYFNTKMSVWLMDCIKDIVFLNMFGSECNVDDYDGYTPVMVCDFANRPKLKDGVTDFDFKNRVSQYIICNIQTEYDKIWDVNVFASFGLISSDKYKFIRNYTCKCD